MTASMKLSFAFRPEPCACEATQFRHDRKYKIVFLSGVDRHNSMS
jgi:hypothetical protein